MDSMALYLLPFTIFLKNYPGDCVLNHIRLSQTPLQDVEFYSFPSFQDELLLLTFNKDGYTSTCINLMIRESKCTVARVCLMLKILRTVVAEYY